MEPRQPGTPPRERQLLTVWNPYYEPETILVHSRVLRAQSAKRDRYVWWGKMYSDYSENIGTRTKWKYLQEYMKKAVADGRQALLFVTDFVNLHALRVDRIKVGELNDEEKAFAPKYYFEPDDRQVRLWFRVRDIRIVEYGLLETVGYLRDMGAVMGPETANVGWFFSPYGSRATPYPLLVEGPGVEEVFRDAPKGRLFADSDEHISPPMTLRMLQKLEEEYPTIWPNLTDGARLNLASAKMSEEAIGGDTRMDMGGSLALLCKALERELVDGILLPSKTELERDATFGTMLHVLNNLLGTETPSWLLELQENDDWWKWARHFRTLRGEGVHRNPISRQQFRDEWEKLLSDQVGFGPVLRVKQALVAQLGR